MGAAHITIKGRFVGDFIIVDVLSPDGRVVQYLIRVQQLRRWIDGWRPCFVYRKGRVYRRGLRKPWWLL